MIDRLDSSRSGWEEEATEIVRRRAKEQRPAVSGGSARSLRPADRRRHPADRERAGEDRFVCGRRSQVTAEQVRELVPLSRAGVIFELGNALAACDLDRALGLVRGLLDQGETAIGILLVAILPTVRNLLLAKDLMERHRLARPSAPFSFISALNRLPAERDRAFAAEEGWLDKRVCARYRGAVGASIPDGAIDRGARGVPGRESSARQQSARSRTDADRDRGQAACALSQAGRAVVARRRDSNALRSSSIRLTDESVAYRCDLYD